MKLINLFLITFLIGSVSIFAQTSSFTYQGSLNDNATQANGTFQMRFSLFNVQTGGNPIGSSIEITAVQVENGIFSISLDFGAAAFDGSNRFLQVEVRRNAGETYVPLSPRQQVKSVPYAVRAATSGNSDQLGGVNSSQYVTSSSNAFIKNSTAQQTGSFNINGEGKAAVFDSANGYGIGGSTVLRRSGSSIFLGLSAGINSTASANAFIGNDAGKNNTTGFGNVFIGEGSGNTNALNDFNTFVGLSSGLFSRGDSNTFIGSNAGKANRFGNNNTSLGAMSDVGIDNLNFATAIGAGTIVSANNTVQLGRTSDRTNVSGVFNVLNGRTSPVERGNVNLLTNTGNLNLYMQGSGNGNGINFGVSSPATGNATLFISQYNGTSYQDRFVINQNGAVEIRQLGSGGSVSLCRNNSLEVALCSSSLRYKSNIENFSNGLDIIKKLRPVSFNWTAGGMLDFGLVAEEVAEVEPLLTTQNEKGETEGVKYDRVGVVLVNAVKQQQKQIEEQNTQIKNQQKQIEELKRIVCSIKPNTEVCQKGENK